MPHASPSATAVENNPVSPSSPLSQWHSPRTIGPRRPRVSVIIVNWNRLADVTFAIRYLRTLRQLAIQTIVVDNGSTDGSLEALREMPDVELIEMGENVGPSRARNAGVRQARGKYTFFLDSDAVVSKRCLPALVRQMDADPKLGIVGCRVMNWHTRKVDQWIYPQSRDRHLHRPFDTYSFSAAGAIARTEVLRKVGGFWEAMGIYNEEVDLSLRVIRAGYRVAYAPDAVVLHRPSPRGRASRANYFRLQVRNWIWIFRRHYPRSRAAWHVGVYGALYLLKATLAREPRAAIRGIVEGLSARDVFADADSSDKMSPDQVRLVGQLNPRLRFAPADWIASILPGGSALPQRPQSEDVDEEELLASLR
jgi:GT2 family glycosyltransferase